MIKGQIIASPRKNGPEFGTNRNGETWLFISQAFPRAAMGCWDGMLPTGRAGVVLGPHTTAVIRVRCFYPPRMLYTNLALRTLPLGREVMGSRGNSLELKASPVFRPPSPSCCSAIRLRACGYENEHGTAGISCAISLKIAPWKSYSLRAAISE